MWHQLLVHYKERNCLVEGTLNSLRPSLVQLSRVRRKANEGRFTDYKDERPGPKKGHIVHNPFSMIKVAGSQAPFTQEMTGGSQLSSQLHGFSVSDMITQSQYSELEGSQYSHSQLTHDEFTQDEYMSQVSFQSQGFTQY